MGASLVVACVQTNSGNDMAANLSAAADLVRRARDQGAALVALPECVAMMETGRARVLAQAAAESDHPALAAFCALAAETGAWLLVGSLTVRLEGERLANRSFLIDGTGVVRARYDKIHMFDVDLPGGESYRESTTYRPGEAAVVADSPWGRIGLTICYDLRFPHLYRALAQAGAGIITVPSAFTRQTGRAHWEVLLRARAIETGAFVIAPAQCGDHPGGRQTYGHSLVVDPWGRVLSEGSEAVGVTTASLDLALVERVRAELPALRHDRAFAACANAPAEPRAASYPNRSPHKSG